MLADLLADLAYRRYLWQILMTQMIREKAALQATNERLREELSRYTRWMVSGSRAAHFDSTPVPPPPTLDKRALARKVMQQRADDERIF